jgi:hypothetical protein
MRAPKELWRGWWSLGATPCRHARTGVDQSSRRFTAEDALGNLQNRAHVAARATFGLLLALGLGCGCKSAWHETRGTPPFIGANTVAKAMSREVRSLSLYMTTNGHEDERVWEGCGKRVPQDQVRREVEAYLLRSRFYQAIRDTTDVTFSTDFRNPDAPRFPQKVAPYKLCVASLCPTIVLMIPFEHGYDAMLKAVSRHGEESEWGTSLGLFPLAGGLHTGTSFPSRVGILWFRPDADAEPRPVNRVDDATDEIKTGDVHLILTHEQNRFRVGRLK